MKDIVGITLLIVLLLGGVMGITWGLSSLLWFDERYETHDEISYFKVGEIEGCSIYRIRYESKKPSLIPICSNE